MGDRFSLRKQREALVRTTGETRIEPSMFGRGDQYEQSLGWNASAFGQNDTRIFYPRSRLGGRGMGGKRGGELNTDDGEWRQYIWDMEFERGTPQRERADAQRKYFGNDRYDQRYIPRKEGFQQLSNEDAAYFNQNLPVGGRSKLNPRNGVLKELKYKIEGVGTKYYFYDTDANRLYETNSKDYNRFIKLKNYGKKMTGGHAPNKENVIIDFMVRNGTTEDLEKLKPQLEKISSMVGVKEKMSIPNRRKRSLELGGGGQMRQRADRRKSRMPTKGIGQKNFFMRAERRGRGQYSTTTGRGKYDPNVIGTEIVKYSGDKVSEDRFSDSRELSSDDRGGVSFLGERRDKLLDNVEDRDRSLASWRSTGGITKWDDTEMRGLRDRRTDGGNYLKGTRTRLGFKSRYQSAIEQAIIDRRIRNTEAEAKLEKAIKEVKDTKNTEITNLRLLKDSADRNVDNLRLKSQKQLHDHNTLVRGNLNATLLGSDAEELNRLLDSGRLNYTKIKDMVRRGEISDVATIHQLDFQIGRDGKVKKLVGLFDGGEEYQINRHYPFRELKEDGSVEIKTGMYQKGGQRGNNLELLMDDGTRQIVRKRNMLDASDPRIDNLQQRDRLRPSITFARDPAHSFGSTGLEVRPAENPSSDLWLKRNVPERRGSDVSTSSSDNPFDDLEDEEQITSLQTGGEKPSVAVAQYNSILTEAPKKQSLLLAKQYTLETLEREKPEFKKGFFGSDNAAEIESREAEIQLVQNEIRSLSATLVGWKRKANKIAAEKGFDIPFTEGTEGIMPARELLRAGFEASPIKSEYDEASELLSGVEAEIEGGGLQLDSYSLGGDDQSSMGGQTGGEEDESAEEEGFGEEGELQPEPQLASPYQSEEEEEVEDTSNLQSELVEAQKRFVRDLDKDDSEVSEGFDDRYYKIKYKGYDLIVDISANKVIDPKGVLPMMDLNPFSSPIGNFIRFSSNEEEADIGAQIDNIRFPPPLSEATGEGEFKSIGWDRDTIDADAEGLFGFVKENRPSEDAIMIWSTQYPDERTTEKTGLYLTRQQLVDKLTPYSGKGKQITKDTLNRFIAKYDKEAERGKVETATNNKKILGILGIVKGSNV